MKANWILKIYNNPNLPIEDIRYQVMPCYDWQAECKAERSLEWHNGASSMSQHDSRLEAIKEGDRWLAAKQRAMLARQAA